MADAAEIRMFERMGTGGFAARETIMYDGWQLRFSEGYTGRTNSVSVLYPSAIDPEVKIRRCEQFYRERGLPCVFKLTDADSELRAALEKRGYRAVKPTDLMAADLCGAGMPEGDVVFSAVPTEEWLSAYFAFEGISDPAAQAAYRRMLEEAPARTCFGALVLDGRIVACASTAAERGYALLQSVVVDPACRGRGLGRAICRALLAEAAANGAERAYLQVVQGNIPALRLYESLGFRKKYAYCYMKQATA